MRRLSCAALALLAFAPGAAKEAERLPLVVAFEVGRGPSPAPEAFLEEVRGALPAEFAARGCFAGVERAPDKATLLVRLLLEDVVEDTRYDLGIADRARSQDGSAELGFVSTFDVHCGVQLETLPGRRPIRVKRFRVRSERRPVLPGEDASEEARSEAVARIVKEARAVVCKGSPEKLLREIESARAAQESEPGAR